MSDIVERLLLLAAVDNCQASIEAADTITRLTAENEQLRAALEEIIQDSFSVYAIQVARAALSGDKHE